MHTQGPRPNDKLVWSYLTLRRAIGMIGLALPATLWAGSLFHARLHVEPSISDYYYTAMGDVFVGALCAIGVFLLTYRGYDRRDDLAGSLACVFAVGVAVFPTARKGVHAAASWVGNAHYISAALMFLILAYFCLVLFRSTNPEVPMTPEKRMRNRVYVVCGILILSCIASIAALKLWASTAFMDAYRPVFWLESIAVMAFGLSWLVKGEFILDDD